MPADLNAATEDLGRRVRKVAESASEAAFGRAEMSSRGIAGGMRHE